MIIRKGYPREKNVNGGTVLSHIEIWGLLKLNHFLTIKNYIWKNLFRVPRLIYMGFLLFGVFVCRKPKIHATPTKKSSSFSIFVYNLTVVGYRKSPVIWPVLIFVWFLHFLLFMLKKGYFYFKNFCHEKKCVSAHTQKF